MSYSTLISKQNILIPVWERDWRWAVPEEDKEVKRKREGKIFLTQRQGTGYPLSLQLVQVVLSLFPSWLDVSPSWEHTDKGS